MNNINNILILFLILTISTCKDDKAVEKTIKETENITTSLSIDHFNIWVKNPNKAKETLTKIGFTSVPDSLSAIHEGQGTSGRYFNFLNGYLELIFIYNQKEFDQNNSKNSQLDFNERANFGNNGASPFSLALKLKDYNVEKIPFEIVPYHQSWMAKNANIYSAKNSKTNLKEPSVFVVYPEIEYQVFDSLTEIENTPSEDSQWKTFFKHPNGAQKITDIIITLKDLELNTKTMEALRQVNDLTIVNGKEHVMELHFDDDIQRKFFDLRPELPLIIYL